MTDKRNRVFGNLGFKAGMPHPDRRYRAQFANLRRALHSGAGTITLWQDDQAMIAAAYKSGGHKTQMDDHNTLPLFDYSSFTRGHVVSSKGMRDGADPMEAVSNPRH
jgi:hypothetical protein